MTTTRAAGVWAGLALTIFVGLLVVANGSSSFTAWPNSGRLLPVQPESVVTYGDDPAQFAKLTLPTTNGAVDPGPHPVAMLVHGGFWKRSIGDLSIMDDVSERMVDEGFAVWNVEYGRVGERAGGWPHTFDHIGEAIDYLGGFGDSSGDDAANALLDLDEVIVVGHSAGGHLALWLRTRADLGDQQPAVTPKAVVALAPIVDLDAAWSDGLGEDAVAQLLGGSPDEHPTRYDYAAVGRPSTIPALVIVSSADDDVPETYSRGVDGADVLFVDDVEHLGLVTSDGPAIAAAVEWLVTSR